MTLATDKQVNVGSIISNAMDAALKKIFQDLAAGTSNGIPVNEHAIFTSLNAKQADALATIVQSGDLQEFLSAYSGIGYNMGFLPVLPTLTVTQQKDVEHISIISAAAPHVLGGGISIGVTGTWTF